MEHNVNLADQMPLCNNAVNHCYHYIYAYSANNYRLTLKSHAELLPIMPFIWYEPIEYQLISAPFGMELRISSSKINDTFHYVKLV